MALAMSAMMVPSAGPFFIAYGRQTRRPAAVAVAVLIYLVVWTAIGLGVDALMNQVMMPSAWPFIAGAVAAGAIYTLTPWSRWARARCRRMCGEVPRESALAEGATYAACCAVCSAGIMAALVVIGMSNILVIALGAAAMFAYKFASDS